MLAEFHLEDFKSYHRAALPLAPLTLLIGANASGKSNALEALRLLSWLAQDHKLSAIRYEVQDNNDVVRGTIGDLPRRGTVEFALGCRVALDKTALLNLSPQTVAALDWERFKARVALKSGELRIIEERLWSEQQNVPLYEVKQAAQEPSHDIRVAYNNFARGGKKPQITCSDQQLVFLQLESAARFEAGHTKAQATIPGVAAAYHYLLSNILFLDPAPKMMRGYAFKGDKRLVGDGRNLSSILFELCAQEGQRQQLLRLIASLPEQNITSIDFVATPRGEVMVQLVETFGGRESVIDAPLLSDGTLRVLAVGAALLSAPVGTMVVIEEIDNGVHPSRANILMESIRAVASERRLRVLLTTHNPALMDALPDEALGDVVFCYRDPADGDSRLLRLADLDRAPSLLAQGTLGDLVTHGILDRFVKRASQERRPRGAIQDWLAELTDAEQV